MRRSLGLSALAILIVAATAAAQPPVKAPGAYDPATEQSLGGVVAAVVSVVGEDGTVGVHANLKTGTGPIVRVHVGPALFIGMNNFYLQVDDQILVRGAWVTHDGETAFWARQVTKQGQTLTLRSPDGTPRWPFATEEDPDGCGVPHAPVRY